MTTSPILPNKKGGGNGARVTTDGKGMLEFDGFYALRDKLINVFAIENAEPFTNCIRVSKSVTRFVETRKHVMTPCELVYTDVVVVDTRVTQIHVVNHYAINEIKRCDNQYAV